MADLTRDGVIEIEQAMVETALDDHKVWIKFTLTNPDEAENLAAMIVQQIMNGCIHIHAAAGVVEETMN